MGRNDDIPGTKCGTMLRGIVTVRQTNPLMPNYQVPGFSKDGNVEVNNPYGNSRKREVAKSVNFSNSHSLMESAAAQVHTLSVAQKLDQYIS